MIDSSGNNVDDSFGKRQHRWLLQRVAALMTAPAGGGVDSHVGNWWH